MGWQDDPLVSDAAPARKQDAAAARASFAAAASAALGVPQHAILAHAALETGADGSKTVGAYNFGNIKAGSSWVGGTKGVDALEYDASGKAYTDKGAKFRSYNTPEEAAADYAALIKSRYPNAAKAKTPEEFAAGLKQGGYATDPQYLQKFAAVAKSQPQRVSARPWESDPVVDAAQPAAPTKSTGRALAEGAARGMAGIGDTILTPLQKVVPGAVGDYLRRIPEAMKWLDADNQDSTAYDVGKVGAQIAATLPVGGVVGGGVKALAGARGVAAAAPRTAQALQAIGNAAQTGGLSAGGVKGVAGMGARVAGGALAGGSAAGLTGGDDGDATQAAIIGGLLPVGFGAAGKAAALGTGLIKPLTGKGQGQIVGDILRTYAHDPDAALAALRQYTGPMVPGSVPLTSAAAGDVGLSGLTRTMQSANNSLANELAVRSTAQNAARSGLLESMAGTPAQMEAAKEARRAASAALREKALADAGSIESGKVLGALDQFLADPNNAGATARAALERVRKQVTDVAGDTGRIDARALYEIRKDIGLAMQGKLQGDAGNLRHAKGVLDRVQSSFDDLIGGAIPQGTEVALPGQARALDPWRQYLANYAEHSKPINQMEQLQEVLRRVQAGTTDMQGNAVISAAKLNNLLKNDGGDLAKMLTPEQMKNLRAVQADLNAGRLGLEAGKSLGSNTAQNISQTWLLNRVLGRYGESPVVSSIMKKPLGLLYGSANEQITDQLGQALLNPELARTLMEQATKRAAPRGLLATSARPAAARGLLSQD